MTVHTAIPPATPEAVKAFEAEIGYDLPAPYRAFLLLHNGGRPEPDAVLVNGEESTLRTLYGLRGDEPDDLRTNAEAYRGEVPPGLLPIGEDDCGNLFCLAVGGRDRGAVFFWDHERDDAARALARVADTFDAFLAGLHESDDPAPPDSRVLSVWVDPEFVAEQRRAGNAL